MITDNQRREIAQELHELRHTTYYREEVVENICDAISIADPANTFREPEDVYKLIADLIDRPTCRNIYDEDEYGACANGFQCSACGHVVEDYEGYRVHGTWNYCPNCGKEVLDD